MWNDHEDHLFGKVKGRSRWVKLADVEDEYLRTDWSSEMNDIEAIESYTESDGRGWIADQTWGFEEIGGGRRYVRHVVVTKGKERKAIKLVYDWAGKP